MIAADDKNLGAICFAKSALQRPVWPIIWNIMLPSRHKDTDLRVLSFSNRLSIKLLNSHDAPRSVPVMFRPCFRKTSRSAGTRIGFP